MVFAMERCGFEHGGSGEGEWWLKWSGKRIEVGGSGEGGWWSQWSGLVVEDGGSGD